MKRWAIWWGLVVTLAAMLGGCASVPAPDTAPHWSGRFALRVQSTPPQSVSAGFELAGAPGEGTLRILSPLGQMVATAQWSASGAALTRGGDTQHYPTLEAMTEALTGTPLPVPALFAWLQGQALPADGWEVDLSGHADHRIQAQRLYPAPAATLRLVFE